jgi:hypothetical protein
MFGAMDFGIADHCQRASRVRRDAGNHRNSSLHYMTFVPYPGNAPAINALLVSIDVRHQRERGDTLSIRSRHTAVRQRSLAGGGEAPAR